MTIETNQIAKAPPKAEAPASPLIPVAELFLARGHTVYLSRERSMAEGVRAVPGRITIFYDPRIRHHRIEMRDGENKAVKVVYMPEAWCSWVPL